MQCPQRAMGENCFYNICSIQEKADTELVEDNEKRIESEAKEGN
jgi:hypothetical protein